MEYDKREKTKVFYLKPFNFYSMIGDWYLDKSSRQHWSKTVYESPDVLNFWFDFLDSEGELAQFAVRTIGQKPEVKNDNSVKSIYQKAAPLVIFKDINDLSSEGNKHTGYSYIDLYSMDLGELTEFTIVASDPEGYPIAASRNEGEISVQSLDNEIDIFYENTQKSLLLATDEMIAHLDYLLDASNETVNMDKFKNYKKVLDGIWFGTFGIDNLESLKSVTKDVANQYAKNLEQKKEEQIWYKDTIDKLEDYVSKYNVKEENGKDKTVSYINDAGDEIKTKVTISMIKDLEQRLFQNTSMILKKAYEAINIISVGSIGRSKNALMDPYDKKYYTCWKYQEFLSNGKIVQAWRGIENSDLMNILFTVAAVGKTAKEALDTMLYNNAYCSEAATITTIPIYYLEPNKRIYIYDEHTGVEGEYILTKITVPLTYNGTMNLTATKAIDRII